MAGRMTSGGNGGERRRSVPFPTVSSLAAAVGVSVTLPQRRVFGWLDQPVHRVTGGEAYLSIYKVLEADACADPGDIADGLTHVLRQFGLSPA